MQDINQSVELKLHDIKPILEVQDYSLYYFLGSVFFAIVLVVSIGYLLYKWYVNTKKLNIRKEHYQKLKKLDLKDTKSTAYNMTLFGATFKDDTPRHSEVYEGLLEKLQAYKYKKEVDSFDKETLEYIKLYRGMLDV